MSDICSRRTSQTVQSGLKYKLESNIKLIEKTNFGSVWMNNSNLCISMIGFGFWQPVVLASHSLLIPYFRLKIILCTLT